MRIFKNIAVLHRLLFCFFPSMSSGTRSPRRPPFSEWLAVDRLPLLAFFFPPRHILKVANRWALFWQARHLAGCRGIIVNDLRIPALSISFTGLPGTHSSRSGLMVCARQRLSTPLLTLKLAAAIEQDTGCGQLLGLNPMEVLPLGNSPPVPDHISSGHHRLLAGKLSASEPFTPNRWVTGIIYSLFFFPFHSRSCRTSCNHHFAHLLGLVYLGPAEK